MQESSWRSPCGIDIFTPRKISLLTSAYHFAVETRMVRQRVAQDSSEVVQLHAIPELQGAQDDCVEVVVQEEPSRGGHRRVHVIAASANPLLLLALIVRFLSSLIFGRLRFHWSEPEALGNAGHSRCATKSREPLPLSLGGTG